MIKNQLILKKKLISFFQQKNKAITEPRKKDEAEHWSTIGRFANIL